MTGLVCDRPRGCAARRSLLNTGERVNAAASGLIVTALLVFLIDTGCDSLAQFDVALAGFTFASNFVATITLALVFGWIHFEMPTGEVAQYQVFVFEISTAPVIRCAKRFLNQKPLFIFVAGRSACGRAGRLGTTDPREWETPE